MGPGRIGARQRVLAQWRRVDITPVERARTLRVKSANDLMPGIFKELRMDTRQSEAEVIKVWNKMLDPLVTAHAQPTGVRKGTLFVTVDSNVWLSEIVRYRRKEILDRLQYCFGKEFVARI